MISINFIMLIALCGAISSAHPLEKRQDADSWRLYAYGDDINGLPIFYADGLYLHLVFVKAYLTLASNQVKLN
jgi:hypothetical protein